MTVEFFHAFSIHEQKNDTNISRQRYISSVPGQTVLLMRSTWPSISTFDLLFWGSAATYIQNANLVDSHKRVATVDDHLVQKSSLQRPENPAIGQVNRDLQHHTFHPVARGHITAGIRIASTNSAPACGSCCETLLGSSRLGQCTCSVG